MRLARVLVITAGAVLLIGSPASAGSGIVGVLMDAPGPFYDTLSETLQAGIRAKHAGNQIIVKTPPADKMARCNSARRFKRVGAAVIVTVGVEVSKLTLAECDHEVVYVVWDFETFKEDRDDATGITWLVSPKSLLKFMAQVRPVKKLALPYHVKDVRLKREVEAVKLAAKALGMTVTVVDLDTGGPEAVDGADAVYVPGLFGGDAASLEQVVTVAMQSKTPVVTTLSNGETDGAFLTYRVDPKDAGQLAADLTNRVLSGDDPEDIPGMRREPELILNRSIAKALRLKVPRAVVDAATRQVK